jgi:small subunit ribosomal protein S1
MKNNLSSHYAQFNDETDVEGLDENQKEQHPLDDFLMDSKPQEKNLTSPKDGKFKVGDKITAEVLIVGDEEIFFSTTLRSSSGATIEGAFLKKDWDKEKAIKKGDKIDIFIARIKEKKGSPHKHFEFSVSPKIKTITDDILGAFQENLPVMGRVDQECKGGVKIIIGTKSAFCPISQLDSSYVSDVTSYLGERFEFLITQYGENGRNIVVSRKKILDQQRKVSENSFFQSAKIGDVVEGKVVRLEPYGAFIEIYPGLEGLCHVSEISWARTQNPSDVLEKGQTVKGKILKIEKVIEKEREKFKVSLSLKSLEGEPWVQFKDQLKENELVLGKVTKLMKFGAFVEIFPGIEGLVPLSEMSYLKRIVRPEEAVKENEKITVMIKEVDFENKKVLLSIKDAGNDPWVLVFDKFPVGSTQKGKVQKRESFGIFVMLEEGVVGLLPKSRVNEVPEFKWEKVKVGDDITVQIDSIDQAERRMSFALPGEAQSTEWKNFLTQSDKKQLTGSLSSQLKNIKLK